MTQYLSIGRIVKNYDCSAEYTIKEILGCGASAIAYLTAYTDGSGRCSDRILKEYYPKEIELNRNEAGCIVYAKNDEKEYMGKMERFIASGKWQNDLRKRTCMMNETPPLQNIFFANNTCYLDVTPYEGRTFADLRTFTLLERLKLCLATAKLINRYHENGLLYLDIKPENIFVLTNSSNEVVTDMVELIDFDSVIEKEKVCFGNSLSYTEAWAAPEQIIPHEYKKISEATDIYAIGELVFWCVFERHSSEDEHRGFSEYPFEYSLVPKKVGMVRRPVARLLTKLFRNTLRSSIRNRFSSMDSVIDVLYEIVEEEAKREFLIETEIRSNSYFIGRRKEIEEIKEALESNNMVFVSGVAGIGKSELIKKYVEANQDQYDHILFWTFEGNLDSMVAKDLGIAISNFSKIEDETEHQYAIRKLKKLRELLSGKNNLIVIDNLDRLIEEIEEQETWDLLRSVHAKILISTKVNDKLGKTILITPMSDEEDLVALFAQYCPFDDEERSYVQALIELVGNHTMLVELLSHYTTATHSRPRNTLEKVRSNGLGGLSEENFRLSKDGKITSDSVYSHVGQIFSMIDISEEQLLVLAKIALMPAEGISAKKFAAFFLMESFDEINWLINHGWIQESGRSENYISVHPTIALVVIEYLRAKEDVLKRLFIDNLNAIRTKSKKELSELEQVEFADAIAQAVSNKYLIKARSAAIFIEQYIQMYSKYGNHEKKLQQIEFAIETLCASVPPNKYSAILEQCYYHKARFLWGLSKNEESILLCKEHLAMAKKAEDYYFVAKWCICLSDMHNNCNDHGADAQMQKYYYEGYGYGIKIAIDTARKNPRFLTDENLIEKLDYDYLKDGKQKYYAILLSGFATWMEHIGADILFVKKGTKSDVANIRRANKLRQLIREDKKAHSQENSIEIVINKAKIAFLSERFDEAEKLVQSIVGFFNDNELRDTLTSYRVHRFLAEIALRKVPYDDFKAIEELEYCVTIGERLLFCNTFGTRVELGYLYIRCGLLEKAERLNNVLKKETKALDPKIRGTYYADVLRNMGYLYYKRGNYVAAKKTLANSMYEYMNINDHSYQCQFGKARVLGLQAKSFLENEFQTSDNGVEIVTVLLDWAKNCYESSVGLNHPEARSIIEQLQTFKRK